MNTSLEKVKLIKLIIEILNRKIIQLWPFLGLNDSRLPLSSILSQLQSELASNKIQNIAVHSLAEIAVRKMKGE